MLVGLWLAACSSGNSNSGQPAPTGSEIYTICGQGPDCQSGICLKDEASEYYCSKTCKTDGDCKSANGDFTGKCRPMGNQGMFCTVCQQDTGFVCIDGKPTKCSSLPDSYCSQCGCADNTKYCATDHCAAKKQILSPCTSDEECIAGDCANLGNNTSKVCLRKLGTSCNDADCEVCQKGTYCSRHCADDYGCQNNDICLFVAAGGQGECYLPCPNDDQSICEPYNLTCTITPDATWYCGPY